MLKHVDNNLNFINMITIVSKEKDRVTFDPRIVEFARGLELYSQDEDIVFEEIISTEFLKALKEFYEGNDFDTLELKVFTHKFN